MKPGNSFNSYEELEHAIRKYEIENFVLLSKRDSRTIASARTSKKINPELKYQELKFTCIHGGKNFKSKGTGKRERRTFQQNCPMMMRFRVSTNGKSLELKQMTEVHNHEVNPIWFKHYNRQRRLDPEVETEILDQFKLNCNKRKIQVEMTKRTGKIITLRDLTNIKAKLRNKKKDPVEKLPTESNASTTQPFEEKRKQLFSITNELAELGALHSNDIFQLRKQNLQTLLQMWKKGIEVKISPIQELGELCVQTICSNEENKS
ncbi:uncharacterized protein LOC117179061 [Belonocnema kinseyi]|uniref:uncharacterized protein LOC117179061 n=1 Tax=Belonocnema kinseyi TaxID=2817044 RepID=UPI00143D6B4A|nr:uncharacterized protein LOC117179061 [Belonocnema kinseyi]